MESTTIARQSSRFSSQDQRHDRFGDSWYYAERQPTGPRNQGLRKERSLGIVMCLRGIAINTLQHLGFHDGGCCSLLTLLAWFQIRLMITVHARLVISRVMLYDLEDFWGWWAWDVWEGKFLDRGSATDFQPCSRVFPSSLSYPVTLRWTF